MAQNETTDTSRPISNIRTFLEDLDNRGLTPSGILDIGANRGYWTEMALSVFPEASVIMIEPQVEMSSVLTKLCEANENLIYIPAGAGAEPGELYQTIWQDLAGSSFVPEIDQERITSGEQRLTPIVTINDLLKEHPHFNPDLVKLDIQGFELEALSGGEALFGKTEVFILETSLFEFLPGQPLTFDCIQFMEQRGYCLYDITDHLRRPYDGALGQVDLAFVKKDSMLRKVNYWNAVT